MPETAVTRLLQELAAAPTRRAATEIFENSGMDCAKRERLYEQIQDVLAELPEEEPKL